MRSIKKTLESAGITVKVQPSITTSSFYLILDNKALGSLRIGDHPGKSKYHYKYEIGSHIRNKHEFYGTFNGKTFVRLKFPAAEVDELVKTIRLEKWNKVMKFGKVNYERWSQ